VIGSEEAGLAGSPSPKKKSRGAKEQALVALEEQTEKKGKEYVQCDGCGKWRSLPKFCNPADLPDQWECSQMVDILSSSRLTCESGQEPLPEGFLSEAEEEEEEEEEGEEGEEAPGGATEEVRAPGYRILGCRIGIDLLARSK
jgi:hypothetical protein